MKRRLISITVTCTVIIALLPVSSFSQSHGEINVIILGNNGTAVVPERNAQSTGIIRKSDLEYKNKIGIERIKI